MSIFQNPLPTYKGIKHNKGENEKGGRKRGKYEGENEEKERYRENIK
jgi:hypothetical protein